jgi:hypothetical protein
MKFKEIDELLQLKIKKSLFYHCKNFNLKLLEKSYVNLNDEYDIESIYCENFEILFKNNKVSKINEIV